MRKKWKLAALFIWCLPWIASGGTTGKITGLVKNTETGKPLIGVNVVVAAADVGAATGADGRYIILNIPPGTYDVVFSMIGYSPKKVENVRIMVDLTTTLNADLSTNVIEGQLITVTADRSLVQPDITYSQANISSAELSSMPVEEFEEVIALQAGVVQGTGGEIHIRGGRSSEVGYMVDGISVTDPYNASMAVEVENNAIQELQLISGTFNAEYGQAMSGIINIITKEGDMKKYGGNLDVRVGRYASTDNSIYFGLLPQNLQEATNTQSVDLMGFGNGFTPNLLKDVQGSLNGPIPGFNARASFYLSGRYYQGDGYLYGIRKYNPDSYIWGNSEALPNTEPFVDFIDVGVDGCGDQLEDGQGGCGDPGTNGGTDPNGDNWDPVYNPGGTEQNGKFDIGEPSNGQWDGGDYIAFMGPNIHFDPALDIWYRDVKNDHIYTAGEDWIVDDSLTYVDGNADGKIDGEIFYDANGDGKWNNHYGDNQVVAMSPTKQLSLQSKLAFKLTHNLKLSINAIYSTTTSRGFSQKWKFNPDGRSNAYRDNFNLGLTLQHNLSSRTFYTLKMSSVANLTRGYLYDIFDVNWNHVLFNNALNPVIKKSTRLGDFGFPEEGEVVAANLANYAVDNNIRSVSTGYNYYISGITTGQSMRLTHTIVYKFDLTSQINETHQVQLGGEYRGNAILSRGFSILYDPKDNKYPVPKIFWPSEEPTSTSFDELAKFPWEASGYFQDKIELKDLIVNAGLRFEVFEPDGATLADPSDPNPYDPLKLIHKYKDLDHSGTITADEAVDNNVQSLQDRLDYWFKPAGKKVQISPRVAVAYPITDQGALHFSYGHFSQLPPYAYLYTNPDFEVGRGSGLGTTMGNANLEPQRTVQYEVGLQQQLTENVGIDITGFYKDIRNLLGSKIIDTFNAGDSYALYINRDYGNVRGITLSFQKRMSQGFAATLDYTFSIAEGNASDPASAYFDASAGIEPEKQLVYLNWDQRHTLNGTLTIKLPFDITASFIGSYGSGLPYTPSFSGTRTSFENSERKPAQMNMDLRMSKSFMFFATRWTLNMNIYNLFDRRNEVVVYTDTGRSEYSLIPTYTQENQTYNALSEYLYRPDYYSAPRQVRIGLSASF